MQKIILVGCGGRMGKVIAGLVENEPDMQIVCGVDVNAEKTAHFPVYADLMEYGGSADVLIDFSNPAALESILSYCVKKSIPPVLCSTGYSEQQIADIKKASEQIPVFRSGNMSVGINLLADLIRKAVEVLGDGYDIEVVEKHHNKKLDAPSGTALMLASAAADARDDDMQYVYDRSGVRKMREKSEIGISSIRGGTIVGEHEVIFAGHDEVITLSHSIGSREVFANGAIKAARYMAGVKKPGMYDMSDVIK